jgi:uncharacterized membrane protein
MTLAPLLNASPAIQLHAFAAMAAFGLGVVQLTAPKGTLPHRTIGWIYVVLMLIVSVSAFFIHELRIWGPWSPIHLLAIFTLVTLPLAVWNAKRHAVEQHRRPVHLPAGTHHARGAVRMTEGRRTDDAALCCREQPGCPILLKSRLPSQTDRKRQRRGICARRHEQRRSRCATQGSVV